MRSLQTEQLVYSELGGDQDLARCVAKFVETLPERVGLIQSEMTSANQESLATLAHQLKGSSRSYGFEPIADLAARLESDCRDGLPYQEILATVDDLVAICQRVRAGVPSGHAALVRAES